MLARDEDAAHRIRLEVAPSEQANLITMAAVRSDAARRSAPPASDALAGTQQTLPLSDNMANVLVIAARRLDAVCEDGSVRCLGE